MLTAIPSGVLSNRDLTPQAIIRKPVSFFRLKGIRFVDSADDLDTFESAELLLNDSCPFALRHYRGEPSDTTTLYLVRHSQSVEEITSTIRHILEALQLSADSLSWERSQDPDY